MFKFELVKFNEDFDELYTSLQKTDLSSRAAIFETLMPWDNACNEMQYPPLYTAFIDDDDDNTYHSWKEIEKYLPGVTVKMFSNKKVVLEGDEELGNHFVMLHLAADTGADLTLKSEDEFTISGDVEIIEYIMNLNNFKYSYNGNKIRLEHMKSKKNY